MAAELPSLLLVTYTFVILKQLEAIVSTVIKVKIVLSVVVVVLMFSESMQSNIT